MKPTQANDAGGGLVIVCPAYEESDSLAPFFQEIAGRFPSAEIVVVDDGSVLHPVGASHLSDSGLNGSVVTLKRNMGHQVALAVGISFCYDTMGAGKTVVVMDSDGEDSPASIHELLDGFEQSASLIRVASRRKRSESASFIVFYNIYKTVFRSLTGHTITFGSFMALKPEALARLVQMNEIWIHLAASVISSRLPMEHRFIDRGTRYGGSSSMNFVSLVLHGFKGMMVFSESVLIRIGALCLGVAIFAAALIFAASVMKILGLTSPGWLTLIIGSMLLIFLQTSVLVLVSLMITVVVRSTNLTTIDYRQFVKGVAKTRDAGPGAEETGAR